MNEEVIALITAPENAAHTLARAIVERRLAACVNIQPAVHSIYWWQGNIEEAGEVLMLVKTTRARVDALDAALAELHPYETYELVVLPIEAGSEPYLRWIRESVA